MKKIGGVLFFIIFISSIAVAQTNLTAKEASKYINKRVSVIDTVCGTKVVNGKLRILYLGGTYPNQKLTVFQRSAVSIFKKQQDVNNFFVLVDGIIRLKKGKPVVYISGKIIKLDKIDNLDKIDL